METKLRLRSCLYCGDMFETKKTKFGYAAEYCAECSKKKMWFRRSYGKPGTVKKSYRVSDEGVVVWK